MYVYCLPYLAVFVDGYNVIGYINSVEGRQIDLSDARDCLISDLAVLKSATGWYIEVVFDAYQTGGAEVIQQVDNVMVGQLVIQSCLVVLNRPYARSSSPPRTRRPTTTSRGNSKS